jgi:uncharacterized protein YjbJ (UPF0337 family)
MSWDIIERNWKQLDSKVKNEWSKLTDHDIETIAGKRDRLAAKIEELYGLSREEVERQIVAFDSRFGSKQRRKAA